MKRVIDVLYSMKKSAVAKQLDELKSILGLGTAAYTASSAYAVAAKGVTNGDSHDHVGGDGAQVDHGGLGGLADNDHTQYVLHSLADAANDFLVASGNDAFVRKTVEQTRAILYPIAAVQEELYGEGDGVVNPLAYCSFLNTDSVGGDFTLADGVRTGQLKKIVLRDNAGGNGVVTGTFGDDDTNTLTFTNEGEFALLIWNGTYWLALELASTEDMVNAPVLSIVS